jgi:hypothetical protein
MATQAEQAQPLYDPCGRLAVAEEIWEETALTDRQRQRAALSLARHGSEAIGRELGFLARTALCGVQGRD